MRRGAAQLIAQRLAAWERDGLAAALGKAGLPAGDVAAPERLFWRFEMNDVPIGFGGLEIHGRNGLLRSIVTLPPLRTRGYGAAIVAVLEVEAAARQCRVIYLITTMAPGFFKRLGYAPCRRSDVPAGIRASEEFAQPASAAIMVKRLRGIPFNRAPAHAC